ncbi:MAG: hypothetical protein J5982_05980 [Bacilli bacterium]|nr:hypothetical protein [Bacilli bacterium]
MIDSISAKDFVELPDIMLDKSKNVKYIQLLSENTIDDYYYSNLRKDLEVIFNKFKDSKYLIHYQNDYNLKSNPFEINRNTNRINDKVGNYIEKKLDLSIWSKDLYNILINLSEELTIKETIYLTSTFFDNKTEEEIEELMDISRKMLYKIKKSCLVKLRLEFSKYNLID